MTFRHDDILTGMTKRLHGIGSEMGEQFKEMCRDLHDNIKLYGDGKTTCLS